MTMGGGVTAENNTVVKSMEKQILDNFPLGNNPNMLASAEADFKIALQVKNGSKYEIDDSFFLYIYNSVLPF